MSKKSQKKDKQKRRQERRKQVPALKSWAVRLGLVMAVVGAGLAMYATQTTVQIERVGIVEASGCSINEFVNCDVAHGSSYAMLMGIPVAWWGFLFYAWAVLALGYAASTTNRNGAAAAAASVWVLSIGAVLYSLVKAYQLTQLGVLCLVCVGMYLVNIALFLLIPLAFELSFGKMGGFLVGYVKSLFGQPSDLSFSPNARTVGVLILAIFGFGFIGMKNYADANFGGGDLDIDRLLEAHFRQQPVEVTPSETSVAWGNAESPVVVVEFGDFQCPGCREAAFHLRPALFELRDEVQVHYMHFPLDQRVNSFMQRQVHPQAGLAAQATECAADRGDFWSYHDDVFENQAQISRRLLLELAEDRDWDVNEFTACLDGDAALARVKADVQQGIDVGVAVTPTVYINGRKLSGWRSAELVRAIVREELRRANG